VIPAGGAAGPMPFANEPLLTRSGATVYGIVEGGVTKTPPFRNGVPAGATLTSGQVGRCWPLVSMNVSEALMPPGNSCSTPTVPSFTIGSRKCGDCPRMFNAEAGRELGLTFNATGVTAVAPDSGRASRVGPGALNRLSGKAGSVVSGKPVEGVRQDGGVPYTPLVGV